MDALRQAIKAMQAIEQARIITISMTDIDRAIPPTVTGIMSTVGGIYLFQLSEEFVN